MQCILVVAIEHIAVEVAGHLPAEASLRGQYFPQRGARHELEDGVEQAVAGFLRIDQADDVQVGETSAEPHLAAKARDLTLM